MEMLHTLLVEKFQLLNPPTLHGVKVRIKLFIFFYIFQISKIFVQKHWKSSLNEKQHMHKYCAQLDLKIGSTTKQQQPQTTTTFKL